MRITKAVEEGWIGTNGYVRRRWNPPAHALAFQGHVVTLKRKPGGGFLSPTARRSDAARRWPPGRHGNAKCRSLRKAALQRRLTFTTQRRFRGSKVAPTGCAVHRTARATAFLMKDRCWHRATMDDIPQRRPARAGHLQPWNIASAFTWSPDGRQVAHVLDNSVCVTDVASGQGPSSDGAHGGRRKRRRGRSLRVFTRCRKLAYVRRVRETGSISHQIFVVYLEKKNPPEW